MPPRSLRDQLPTAVDQIARRGAAVAATKANANAVGIGPNATNLGTFTSPLIDDNQTVKAALESIGTNLAADTGAENIGTATGGTLAQALFFVTPEQYGAVGDATSGSAGTDDTVAVQAAINAGMIVYFAKKYRVSALTAGLAGQVLTGPGTIYKKADVDGRVFFNDSYAGVKIIGLTFDGTAAAPTPGPTNDLIRYQGSAASDGLVENCIILGSKGTGIRFDSAARCRAINNKVLNCQNNNILIANRGADDCIAQGNFCNGTTTGNNIFVTTSDGSQATSDIIYRAIVTNNICTSAADTNIEFGINTYHSIMTDNFVTGSYNPGLLGRDCKYCQFSNNIIVCPAVGAQALEYTAIALTLQHQPGTHQYESTITGNMVLGRGNRGHIYADGNKVDITNNRMIDNVTAVGADGFGLVGRGVVIASGGTGIRINDNYIENVSDAIQWNLAADARTMTNCETNRNTIIGTDTAVAMFNCTLTNCEMLDNKITKVVDFALQIASATYAGQLRYWGNSITLGGYSGASPVQFNPASAQRTGLLTHPDMKYLLVPENNGAAVVLATGDEPSWGDLIVQFTDLSQVATFDLGGRVGIGTGTTLKRIGTSDLLPSADSGGSAGWSVFYDGLNNLILERRGTSTGSGARYMKTLVRTV